MFVKKGRFVKRGHKAEAKAVKKNSAKGDIREVRSSQSSSFANAQDKSTKKKEK